MSMQIALDTANRLVVDENNEHTKVGNLDNGELEHVQVLEIDLMGAVRRT